MRGAEQLRLDHRREQVAPECGPVVLLVRVQVAVVPLDCILLQRLGDAGAVIG